MICFLSSQRAVAANAKKTQTQTKQQRWAGFPETAGSLSYEKGGKSRPDAMQGDFDADGRVGDSWGLSHRARMMGRLTVGVAGR